MRTQVSEHGVALWLSARDTEDWARGNAPWGSCGRWPCSALAGNRVFAGFDANGLCELEINGGRGEQDMPADEFNAIASDALATKVRPEHTCYFVTVGQFRQ